MLRARSPRLSRAAEFAALFIGGPLLILWLHRPGVLFGALWLGALLAWVLTRHVQPRPHRLRRELSFVLLRFVVLSVPLAVLTALWLPEGFLDLPRQRPLLWAAIMLLYPLLSVWPQEMLYRAFLFARYDALFGGERGCIVASAAAFGFAHIIFVNWVAVAMTVIGGALFARDYARHRSLRLVCVEHALFGCLIFTIGLGRFFYTGSAWRH